MKLVRPDTFHPRIVLAGGARQAAGDDAGLVAALRTRGLHARWLPWDHQDVADAHLVILRDAGDYAARLPEFLAWTTRVQNLLNPPAVVAWNADRGYLDDLRRGGVPTAPGHAHNVPETVLVFVGGKPSHAFVARDGGLHQGEADFELWDVGAAALAAAPGELLFARVHLVGQRVLELRLVDPSLGWLRLDTKTRGLAQREFALAVESALDGFGLGPFARRGLHGGP